ncbi:MAG: hypothetical protein KDD42_02465, partial [Bdellovibrionales bacterium]|nr:hypothetical protein [Bdellovibrionales bacterium]
CCALVELGAGQQVETVSQVVSHLERLAVDRDFYSSAGRAAQNVWQASSGAADRIFQEMIRTLNL